MQAVHPPDRPGSKKRRDRRDRSTNHNTARSLCRRKRRHTTHMPAHMPAHNPHKWRRTARRMPRRKAPRSSSPDRRPGCWGNRNTEARNSRSWRRAPLRRGRPIAHVCSYREPLWLVAGRHGRCSDTPPGSPTARSGRGLERATHECLWAGQSPESRKSSELEEGPRFTSTSPASHIHAAQERAGGMGPVGRCPTRPLRRNGRRTRGNQRQNRLQYRLLPRLIALRAGTPRTGGLLHRLRNRPRAPVLLGGCLILEKHTCRKR